MNAPQFFKGQTLTAESLNQLAQNQRELSDRVGSAGLASRYIGPQQLKHVPTATGVPEFLPPRDAPSAVSGCYLREPWVEDALRTQATRSFSLEKITRSNGADLRDGDEIFQKITVSDTGAYISSVIQVFTSSEAPEPTDLWEPGSGTTSILYRRLGSVIPDPRLAQVGPDGEPLPFRPLILAHHDGEIPILPRNASTPYNTSSVALLGSLTGSTLPVKKLIAGANVTIKDGVSSVEIAAAGGGGGGGSVNLAESEITVSGSVLNLITTPGIIDGIRWDNRTLPDSSVLRLFPQPAISNGCILLPVGIQGFTTSGQPSGVIFQNLYTSGAQRSTLATLTIGGETRELCAHYANGFLSLSFI